MLVLPKEILNTVWSCYDCIYPCSETLDVFKKLLNTCKDYTEDPVLKSLVTVLETRKALKYTEYYEDYEFPSPIPYAVGRSVPNPLLPYGVPDVDYFGHVIPENVESNNRWKLLFSMLETVDKYDDEHEIEMNQKLVPRLETIARFDVTIRHFSFVRYLSKEQVLNLSEILCTAATLNEDLAQILVSVCEEIRPCFFDQYITRGVFKSTVVVTSETRKQLITTPDYPKKFNNQVIKLYHDDPSNLLFEQDLFVLLESVDQSTIKWILHNISTIKFELLSDKAFNTYIELTIKHQNSGFRNLYLALLRTRSESQKARHQMLLDTLYDIVINTVPSETSDPLDFIHSDQRAILQLYTDPERRNNLVTAMVKLNMTYLGDPSRRKVLESLRKSTEKSQLQKGEARVVNGRIVPNTVVAEDDYV